MLRTIAVIPWAYVGFESISHSAEEFSFSPRKAFVIMAAAIAMAAFAYVLMLIISVIAVPEGYADWIAYVNDLDKLEGVAAVPTFSAIFLSLGDGGVALLQVTMLGALFSSLVGSTICLSRLVCTMAENGIFPACLSRLGEDGVPRNAIASIVCVSLVIPFLGRTAIGWNMDISNVAATIAYGYTSYVAYSQAKATSSKSSRVFGIAGVVIAAVFLILMILPADTLAQESYLIFTGWIILGFLLNYRTFKRDDRHLYGRSPIVWTALLLLSIFTCVSFIWHSSETNAQMATEAIEEHYAIAEASLDGVGDGGLPSGGVEQPADAESGAASERAPMVSDGFVGDAIASYRSVELRDVFIVILLLMLSFRILLGNYSIMNKREMESELALSDARVKAYTDKLTGVKSVNSYREREREIDACIAEKHMDPFTVLICDVNNVKEVNDTLGHQAGDDYIRMGSALICDTFGHSPVFRIGGDEFVVLLEGRDYERREELMRSFESSNVERLEKGEIVIAIGAADWRPEQDSSFADVFARADIVMYQRKRALKALDGTTS